MHLKLLMPESEKLFLISGWGIFYFFLSHLCVQIYAFSSLYSQLKGTGIFYYYYFISEKVTQDPVT
jgi:hypothetical protein